MNNPQPASRPDYVKCVRTGMHDPAVSQPTTATWCGREYVMAWCFTDAAHATLHADQGGRLLICPACAAAIIGAIQKGTWGGIATPPAEQDPEAADGP